MLSRHFDRPVKVWTGLGFVRQIATVFEAYQFAREWCGNSPEQRAAIRACRAAMAGDIDPETARGVFVAFLRRKDILADSVPDTLPWLASAKAGRGGLSA